MKLRENLNNSDTNGKEIMRLTQPTILFPVPHSPFPIHCICFFKDCKEAQRLSMVSSALTS